ncbi:hypothetical protein ALO45_200102 [Pseudomonas syringae pv. syringae]|nr:hypothetical protein ALO45_200102 [Pseudomonas syringae pv. syringae]
MANTKSRRMFDGFLTSDLYALPERVQLILSDLGLQGAYRFDRAPYLVKVVDGWASEAITSYTKEEQCCATDQMVSFNNFVHLL